MAPGSSRRRFLKGGVALGLALAFGGGLALFPSAHVAAPTRALLVLEPRTFQILVAVAQRVVTAAGADHVAVAHGVDAALARMPVETQADINKLLGLVENALPGLLLDLRVGPFTRLSPDARDAVLDQWRRSRIALRRTGYQALRKLCLAAHYAQEASWVAVGYDPPNDMSAVAYDDSMAGTPSFLAAQAPGKEP